MTREHFVVESEASHKHLTCAILNEVLVNLYGPKVHLATCDYTYPEIMEMMYRPGWLKNLAENIDDYDDEEIPGINRVAYLADQVANIVKALSYDITEVDFHRFYETSTSEKLRTYLGNCDNRYGYGSELWTMDYFDRNLVRFDKTGFFTEIIIMATLQARGVWYTWREKKYNN